VLLARQVGLKNLVVFLNKCDQLDDEELLELVEMEVRELLALHEFPADDTPIVRGSALCALEGREADSLGQAAVLELMKHVDSYIPTPVRDTELDFLMPVEGTFSIAGRGTVVTGRVERGTIRPGEEIEIVGLRDTQKTTVTGVEMFHKMLDAGYAGDNVGCLLRGLKRDDVTRGQVLCKPKTVHPIKKFSASVYALTKDEGGRHTPFFANYRPQFFFRTADVTGSVSLDGDREMVMPGDNAEVTCELIQPMAIHEGMRFAFREGGKTVGAGVVGKLIE